MRWPTKRRKNQDIELRELGLADIGTGRAASAQLRRASTLHDDLVRRLHNLDDRKRSEDQTRDLLDWFIAAIDHFPPKERRRAMEMVSDVAIGGFSPREMELLRSLLITKAERDKAAAQND